ncbi:AAA family ATPase [Algoriphagus lutimaris]|uniref:AAA family ATPase n=1 Tax=Algoriphagus lutimaris TaxID=613197 RepID=UPI00196B4823|nr:AAA family ATPase [Algoriphagus lutimaris]MBN3520711.1 AAA family ATPase [Algoriphagus lutimaris]
MLPKKKMAHEELDSSSATPATGIQSIAEHKNTKIKVNIPPRSSLNLKPIDPRIISAKLDFSEEIEHPPVCLSMNSGQEEIPFGTLGNFTLITGKAKSRKTFTQSLFIGAMIRGELQILKGYLPLGQNKIIYFDTEQSRFHVQLVYRRIAKLTNCNPPENLEVYCLRPFSPRERIEIIDNVINSSHDLAVVIIDGARDLVNSINDETESTEVSTYLMKWTEQKNIHLITVLHQNKGDNNARGHLGTELINKAETTLTVRVDPSNKEVSIVEAEFTRGLCPEPFAFRIDENGLPQIIGDWEASTLSPDKKRKDPTTIIQLKHEEFLDSTFQNNKIIAPKELMDAIKNQFDLGDSKAKEFRSYYLDMNVIERLGKETSPKAKYKYIPENWERKEMVKKYQKLVS